MEEVTTASPLTLSENMQTKVLAEMHLNCEHRISRYNEVYGDNRIGFCPPIWDSMLCWDSAKAGMVHTMPCPAYVVGSLTHRFASKECLENGTWFIRTTPDRISAWTNFTQCFTGTQATVVVRINQSKEDDFILPYLQCLKTIAEVGYSISLISLIMAFTILISIKKLRCPRNVLHMHLFASFIMRAFMSLLKDSLFVQGLAPKTHFLDGEYFTIEREVHWSCKLHITLWHYFVIAHYFWIFMEGLYLHNLIFLALFTDSSSITMYIVLGWGLPVIFVVPWSICRALLDDEFCWTMNRNKIIFLLIHGPTTATIVVNFILFIKIITVLLRKLQSSICEENKTYRRWAKSTLVLIPLFGVNHFVFLGLQYSSNQIVELVYLFCDQIFSCFNGFFVALLYCFLNGEVRHELAKKWNNFSFRDLLESWHLLGHNSIFSSSRFLGNNERHRPSCESNTSCTVDSVVHHSCSRDKKRQHIIVAVPIQETQVRIDEKKGLTDGGGSHRELDPSEMKNGFSSLGKNRRWSNSDINLDDDAVELKSMTSPNSVVKL